MPSNNDAELLPEPICEHCRESLDAHHHRNLKCPTLETIYREAFVGHDGKAWPETMDAAAWAKSWLRIIAMHPNVPTDEGTMIGWFANALMRGYDATRAPSAEYQCLSCGWREGGAHCLRCLTTSDGKEMRYAAAPVSTAPDLSQFEDELPADMPADEYSKWFDASRVVDGVRIGPKYSPAPPASVPACLLCGHSDGVRADGYCAHKTPGAYYSYCCCKCKFPTAQPATVPGEGELIKMLRLRKELDPDAPDAIVFPTAQGDAGEEK